MITRESLLRPLVFTLIYGAYKGLSSIPRRKGPSFLISNTVFLLKRLAQKLRNRFSEIKTAIDESDVALRPAFPTVLRKGLLFVVLLLLVAAVGDWPYNFYVFLRIAVTGTLLFVLRDTYERREVMWLIAIGLIVLMFNPVAPFRFDKSEWRWLDFISAAVISSLAALSREKAQP